MTTALNPPYSIRRRWQAAYRDWRRGRWTLDAGQHPADMAMSVLRMAFAPPFQRPFSATFDRRAAVAAAAAPWWLSGGAPAPAAVWQAIGAASLAASYLRVAGSSGNANLDPAVVGSGIAPAFNPMTGWYMDSFSWLQSGVTAATDKSWSYLIRYANFANPAANPYLLGGSGSAIHAIRPGNAFGPGIRYYNGGSLTIAAMPTAAVLAVAGATAYRDGVAEAGTITTSGSTANPIAIGGMWDGSSISGRSIVNILAVAVWDTSTGHATWMPAVMAAAAAL